VQAVHPDRETVSARVGRHVLKAGSGSSGHVR